MENLAEWVQDAILVLLFVISTIGGLVAYEMRRLHSRIDKYVGEMDAHVRDSVKVHTSLERIETKLDIHTKNGGHHK